MNDKAAGVFGTVLIVAIIIIWNVVSSNNMNNRMDEVLKVCSENEYSQRCYDLQEKHDISVKCDYLRCTAEGKQTTIVPRPSRR